MQQMPQPLSLANVLAASQLLVLIIGGLAVWGHLNRISAKWDFMLGLLWSDYCQRKGISFGLKSVHAQEAMGDAQNSFPGVNAT